MGLYYEYDTRLDYYKYTKRLVIVMNNSIHLPHFDWLIDNNTFITTLEKEKSMKQIMLYFKL